MNGVCAPSTIVISHVPVDEVQIEWLKNEYSSPNPIGGAIRRRCDCQGLTKETLSNPENLEKIQNVFNEVRGKYDLWLSHKENAAWEKVQRFVTPQWVRKNLVPLFPSEDRFPVHSCAGVVVFEIRPGDARKYVLEGNHRISAIAAEKTSREMPLTMYVGTPQDPDPQWHENVSSYFRAQRDKLKTDFVKAVDPEHKAKLKKNIRFCEQQIQEESGKAKKIRSMMC